MLLFLLNLTCCFQIGVEEVSNKLVFSGYGVLTKEIVKNIISNISSSTRYDALEVTGNIYLIEENAIESMAILESIQKIIFSGVVTVRKGNFKGYRGIRKIEFDKCLTYFEAPFEDSYGVVNFDLGNFVRYVSIEAVASMNTIRVGPDNWNYEWSNGYRRYLLYKGGKQVAGISNTYSSDFDIIYPNSVTTASYIYTKNDCIKVIDFGYVEVIDETFYLTSSTFTIRFMDAVKYIHKKALRKCINGTITLPPTLIYIAPDAISDSVTININNCPNYKIHEPNTGVRLFVDEINKTIISSPVWKAAAI